MMTSRSEYRLLLRQDNADARLTPLGHEIGLISESRWKRFEEKQQCLREELARVRTVVLQPSEALNALLVSHETSPVSTGVPLCDLIRRPQLSYADLRFLDPAAPVLPDSIVEEVEIEIKYEGYIRRQLEQVERMRRLESRPLPPDFDYLSMRGLRLEAREKLDRIRPLNLGQASRISGVSPADISILLIELENRQRRNSHDPA